MKHRESFINDFSHVLVEKKIVSLAESQALQKAFHDSDAALFEDFLLQEGLVSELDLLDALEFYYKVPSVDVVGIFFEHNELIKFPKEFLLHNGIIPWQDDEDIMLIIASDPANQELLAKIGEYVSYDIQFRVGFKRDICDAIKEFYDTALTQDNIETFYDQPESKDISHRHIDDAQEGILPEGHEFVHDAELMCDEGFDDEGYDKQD